MSCAKFTLKKLTSFDHKSYDLHYRNSLQNGVILADSESEFYLIPTGYNSSPYGQI